MINNDRKDDYMEAVVKIDGNMLSDEERTKLLKECLAVMDQARTMVVDETPFIKGYVGLQKFLGVGYPKVQAMIADGLQVHERCGSYFFDKKEVYKYLMHDK